MLEPFQKASYTELSPEQLLREMPQLSKEQAEDLYKRMLEDELYINSTYQVAIRRHPGLWHLSIKRRDREIIHDWRDLQEIKNVLTDPEFEAIELYPAESRRVDSANQYHLWVFPDKSYRVPVGFQQRFVQEDVGPSKAKQRKFE